MSNRILIGCLLAGMCLVTALAVGQQGEVDRASSGPFAVTCSEKSAFLLEVNSGRTWLLDESVDPHRTPVWLPLERLDTEEEAAKWRAEEQVRTQHLSRTEQAAKLRARLEELRTRTVRPENSPVMRQLETALRNLETSGEDGEPNAQVQPPTEN